MILDNIDNWRNYSLGPAWEKAFGFLDTLDPSAPEEETKIDDDHMFARVMSYPTRDETSSDAVLEAHRRYADIQMVLIGSERIAWYPTSSLNAKTAYDQDKDVQFSTTKGQQMCRSVYSRELLFSCSLRMLVCRS